MTQADSDAGFGEILRYVDGEMPFEPGSYNDSYLDRRISARMRRTDAESYTEYLEVLSSDHAEREALLAALSINVTSFFRNPGVWEQLREVLRRLTEDQLTVRCWSAACADGREPYSLAMLARDDDEIDDRSVEITATDIDGETLAEARRGLYESTRTTDIGSQLEPLLNPDAHVEIDEARFTVREPVREMVSFEQHDLISGDSKRGYDLVLCRNLLIYIDTSYKEAIFETLTEAIERGGYLTIGKSETLPRSFRKAYDAFDRDNHIYRRE